MYKQYKFLNNFEQFLDAENNLSRNTVKNYLSDIRFFIGWLRTYDGELFALLSSDPSISHLESVFTGELVSEYAVYLKSHVRSIITVKRRLSSLNKLIQFVSGSGFRPSSMLDNASRQMRPNADSGSTRQFVFPLQSRKDFFAKSVLSEYQHDTDSDSSSIQDIRSFLDYVIR